MTELSASFGRDQYAVLNSLLSEPDLSMVYRYARKIVATGMMRADDPQVPGTPWSSGDWVMDGLLTSLQPRIERASGLRLFPTYSYFRVYKPGDTLKKHTDRPACEISVTLCLGYAAHKPWPIWIEGPNGVASISLERGNALIYRGLDCPHWREPFEGSHHAQTFLHYVDQNGPHAEWKFDKKGSLASLPPVTKLRSQILAAPAQAQGVVAHSPERRTKSRL